MKGPAAGFIGQQRRDNFINYANQVAAKTDLDALSQGKRESFGAALYADGFQRVQTQGQNTGFASQRRGDNFAAAASKVGIGQ